MVKRVGIFIFGFILLILGMALVINQWPAVVTVFVGVGGPLLAVAGLVVLFASTLKENA